MNDWHHDYEWSYDEYGGADLIPCAFVFDILPLGPGPRRPAHELAAMPYRDYLLTREWRETRRKRLSASERRCAECGVRHRLHVHHLTYDRLGEEALDDLQVLCAVCHRVAHGILA